MVPFSFGCGSAVLAAIATLAPSRAARSAIASPMPRLPPETNSVLPLSDVIVASLAVSSADCASGAYCPAASAPRVRGSGAPSNPFGVTAIELAEVWPIGSTT